MLSLRGIDRKSYEEWSSGPFPKGPFPKGLDVPVLQVEIPGAARFLPAIRGW